MQFKGFIVEKKINGKGEIQCSSDVVVHGTFLKKSKRDTM